MIEYINEDFFWMLFLDHGIYLVLYFVVLKIFSVCERYSRLIG